MQIVQIEQLSCGLCCVGLHRYEVKYVEMGSEKLSLMGMGGMAVEAVKLRFQCDLKYSAGGETMSQESCPEECPEQSGIKCWIVFGCINQPHDI